MKSYRDLLREELEARKAGNQGKYSMRKMADDLGISPAYLSMVLNGKRALTEKLALEVVSGIGWSDEKKKLFIDLVRYEHTGNPSLEQSIKERISKDRKNEEEFIQLKHDMFCAISQWYHNGIMALISTKGFKNDIQFISKKLAITEIEADVAMSRLLRLGMVKEKNGRLEITNEQWYTGDIPSKAIRKFHHQMLKKAEHALEHHSKEERNITGLTISTKKSLLPEAHKKNSGV